MRILLFTGAALLISLAACSKQGLGDRCDRRAAEDAPGGESDCESGLVCTRAGDLSEQSDRCCPPEGADPQVFICSRNKGTGAIDAGIPETSTGDTGTTTDASDAASNDASDAVADAPDEGG